MIKYSDKSEGQPELIPIFDSIKASLKTYIKGSLKEVQDEPGIYNVVIFKPLEIAGKKLMNYILQLFLFRKGM